MATGEKVKRTYNLSRSAVDLVRYSVEELGAAPTQDAFVEEAITVYARRLRDAQEAALWRQAATDAEYQADVQALERLFAGDDARAWEE
ncbi:MAG TPA: hypothetical protein VFE42_28160 [Chloroflexota bacterium]|nr:hypothetical protein [Chloroflexota bacterium]